MREHGTGRGAKYTRGRGPFGLCGYQDGLTREEALRLERRIKRLSVEEKRRFITGLVRPETSVSADRRRVAVLPSEGG
jgi:putative endonuclease